MKKKLIYVMAGISAVMLMACGTAKTNSEEQELSEADQQVIGEILEDYNDTLTDMIDSAVSEMPEIPVIEISVGDPVGTDMTADETQEETQSTESSMSADYFLGTHVRSYDESDFTVEACDDGTYSVYVSIVRLCSLENGVGTYEDGKMQFTAIDPSEQPIKGCIYVVEDGSFTIEITDSTWTYLPNGDLLEGFGK